MEDKFESRDKLNALEEMATQALGSRVTLNFKTKVNKTWR